MTERPKVTDQTACAHVGARPLRWSAVVVSRGLRAGAMGSTPHTRSTHTKPAAATCAILGASLLVVGAVLMKPVESSGISPRIDGANGSIDPHQESNMKTLHAFRTAGALGVLAITQIALVSGASAQSAAVQWRVEDGGNGHWYRLSTDQPSIQQWTQNSAPLGAPGFHLAVVNNSAENAHLVEMISAYPGHGFWIGYYRINGTTWGWNINQGSTFLFWGGTNCGAGPYPNYGYSGFIAALYNKRPDCGWNWDDFAPEITPNNWQLLEYDADCNADNIVDFGQCLDGSLPDINGNNIPDCCEQGIPCSPCSACDLNPTGIVDGADLGALLAFWGPVSPAFPRADINRDGNVNGADLGLLLANWGPCGQ